MRVVNRDRFYRRVRLPFGMVALALGGGFFMFGTFAWHGQAVSGLLGLPFVFVGIGCVIPDDGAR